MVGLRPFCGFLLNGFVLVGNFLVKEGKKPRLLFLGEGLRLGEPEA